MMGRMQKRVADFIFGKIDFGLPHVIGLWDCDVKGRFNRQPFPQAKH